MRELESVVRLTAAPSAVLAPDLVLKGSGEVIIGPFTEVQERTILDTGTSGRIQIGTRSKLKVGFIARAYGNALVIGDRTSIGEYSFIASHGGVSIGSLCIFGPYVFINAAAHIIDGPEPLRFQGETARGIVIDNNVWLGARTTVLDGVRIGQRVVVGAHSMVTRDVGPSTLVAGAPARRIRAI